MSPISLFLFIGLLQIGLSSDLSVMQIVPYFGYPLQTHQVTTDDGYILTMHRIPHGTARTNSVKPPVLILHGILSSSVDFVNLGPGKSLGFLLADAGYDVWLANNRGNTWSRKHLTIDPDLEPARFFNFSFHEIAIYDMPACIDYILNLTNQRDLFYIGHSQGSTVLFAMTAERPEYNSKIRLAMTMAPVSYNGHVPSPFSQFTARHLDLFKGIMDTLEIHEVLPHYNIFTQMGRWACVDGSPFQGICALILFLIGGFNSPQLNRSLLPLIYAGVPAGCSTKQLIHIFQLTKEDHFARFDYGMQGNLAAYNKPTPPSYNISNIRAPVILHYSQNDWLCATKDVERLGRKLPNLVAMKLVPLPTFNHLDFLWSRDIVKLVNREIVAEIQAYT